MVLNVICTIANIIKYWVQFYFNKKKGYGGPNIDSASTVSNPPCGFKGTTKCILMS